MQYITTKGADAKWGVDFPHRDDLVIILDADDDHNKKSRRYLTQVK